MGTQVYERRIRAGQYGIGFDAAALWAYRDLLFLLVKRDFLSKYKQSVLGPIWFILQPLLMTVVFTAVFSRVAQLSTDGLPAPLFYMAGLLGWNYFNQTFGAVAGTFTSNMHIFSKVYFPRLVVPLAMAITNLITFLVQLATFCSIYIYFKIFTSASDGFGFSAYAFLLPFLLLQTMILSLGVGLSIAAISAKYRDFVQVSGMVTQIWLYATPVIYPSSRVPVAWRGILALNPMTGIIEMFRYCLLGRGTLNAAAVVSSLSFTAIAFFVGLFLFRRVERTVVDIA